MLERENPAEVAGLPKSVLSGEDKPQGSRSLSEPQAQDRSIRLLEAEARSRTRAALLCRGVDRLQGLAVAATYARAARTAVRAAILGGAL